MWYEKEANSHSLSVGASAGIYPVPDSLPWRLREHFLLFLLFKFLFTFHVRETNGWHIITFSVAWNRPQ